MRPVVWYTLHNLGILCFSSTNAICSNKGTLGRRMRAEGIEGIEGGQDLSYLGDSLMRSLFEVLKAASETTSPTLRLGSHVEGVLACVSQGSR